MVKRPNVTVTFNAITIFLFIGTFFVYGSFLLYALLNDYAFFELDQVAVAFNNSGMINDQIYPAISDTFTTATIFPAYLDYFFLASFIYMIVGMFMISYKTRRQGYFEFLAVLTYGMMFIMFILSLVVTFSVWFRDDIILAVLPTISLSLPFFSYYLENVGLINFIVILICLILNFVDLDMSKFKSRKDKDMVNDEI